jgi:hypothetical protein
MKLKYKVAVIYRAGGAIGGAEVRAFVREGTPLRGGGPNEGTAALAVLDALAPHAICGYQPCNRRVSAPKAGLFFVFPVEIPPPCTSSL